VSRRSDSDPPCNPHRRALPAWELLFLTLVAVHLAASALEAQTVRGRVIDASTGEAVRQATVAVMLDGRTVAGSLTDDRGHFVIMIGEPGSYGVRASGPGYLPRDLAELSAQPGEEVTLSDIRLEPNPIVIDEITVEVRRGRGRLTGEDRVRIRQLYGEGTFIPGALLAVEQPSSLTQYLAERADLHVRYDFYGSPYLWSPIGPYHCLILQVNHWPMSALGYRSLDEINLRRIAAIEIYNTAAEVPPESQLQSFIEDPRYCSCGRCGLVNVWYWSSW
jgi:hypothetical protein